MKRRGTTSREQIGCGGLHFCELTWWQNFLGNTFPQTCIQLDSFIQVWGDYFSLCLPLFILHHCFLFFFCKYVLNKMFCGCILIERNWWWLLVFEVWLSL
ncbi:hypothetical protein ACS0TY_006937 [Phlomoides rotata]